VEASGLDLAKPLALAALEMLHDALLRHGVLLLRGQRALLPSLAHGLAALEVPLLCGALHQAPPVLPLTVDLLPDLPPSGSPPNPFWHADLSYAAEPALACLLRAEAHAGEIAFVDQRRVLSLLPAGLRARLDSLRAMHASPLDTSARAEHPVLRRHPVTGESTLYVNPAFTRRILNLPAADSQRLLATLFAAATAESLTWRHVWHPGDVLIWDNRSVLHTACAGPGLEALRIGGDRPHGVETGEMPWVMAG
jgi:taurine dioxygenase